jgi:hypothetical protein
MPTGEAGLTGGLVALMMTVAVLAAGPQGPPQHDSVQLALDNGAHHRHLGPGVIVAWNELAHDIAVAEDQFLTFKGQRALAIMHLALHDALNAIVPMYERYAYDGPQVIADPIAAAAQAAYEVLVSQYPDRQPMLGSELAKWLTLVPQSELRSQGVDLGRAVAAAILVRRANDGWDVPGSYEFASGPGEYQTTPPWNGFVVQPGFRSATPFVLRVPSQFRPPPPPPLESARYVRAFEEVKQAGAIHSPVRTDDQTAYAVWWMEFAEGSVNRLARQLVTEHDAHLWTTARLFAHVGMALFDSYVAMWDAKYEYNHWRPYTAIREANVDNNSRTEADPNWEPLRTTPPFPEYLSAHATACAASFGVLERLFSREVPFTMATTTAPPGIPTRTFASFRAAALECADSRVRLGWHFRYSTEAGLELGERIARLVVRRSLRTVSATEK